MNNIITLDELKAAYKKMKNAMPCTCQPNNPKADSWICFKHDFLHTSDEQQARDEHSGLSVKDIVVELRGLCK